MSLFRNNMSLPDPDNPPIPQEENLVLDKLARKVVEKRMTTPAIMFVESVKPLNFIGSQAMVFFEPIIQTIFNFNDYDTLRRALERRETLEILLRKIEKYDAIALRREKRFKKWLKRERKNWKWYQRYLGLFAPRFEPPDEIGLIYDEAYTKSPDLFGSEPEPTLKDYIDQIGRTAPVMDIGVGQGRNALFLARKGFRVEAVDPSQVAVDLVTEQSRAERLDVTARCGRYEIIEKDARFSAVLLYGLIQLLKREQIEDLIDRTKEWLTADGLVFVTTFGVDDPGYAKYSRMPELGKNSFRTDTGQVRTYLETDEILELFRGWETVHHREELGSEHSHGDNPPEQHHLIEAVFRKK